MCTVRTYAFWIQRTHRYRRCAVSQIAPVPSVCCVTERTGTVGMLCHRTHRYCRYTVSQNAPVPSVCCVTERTGTVGVLCHRTHRYRRCAVSQNATSAILLHLIVCVTHYPKELCEKETSIGRVTSVCLSVCLQLSFVHLLNIWLCN
jgi:hypothetical protein